jgi:hypothetical protein
MTRANLRATRCPGNRRLRLNMLVLPALGASFLTPTKTRAADAIIAHPARDDL